MEHHHVWCNIQQGDPKNCKQCKKFFALYPEKENLEEMTQTYFPDVKIRPNTGPETLTELHKEELN